MNYNIQYFNDYNFDSESFFNNFLNEDEDIRTNTYSLSLKNAKSRSNSDSWHLLDSNYNFHFIAQVIEDPLYNHITLSQNKEKLGSLEILACEKVNNPKQLRTDEVDQILDIEMYLNTKIQSKIITENSDITSMTNDQVQPFDLAQQYSQLQSNESKSAGEFQGLPLDQKVAQIEQSVVISTEKGEVTHSNVEFKSQIFQSCKEQLRKQLANIKTQTRKDILLKSIIRGMRKHYKSDFLNLTKYQQYRRYKDPSFLEKSLQEYSQSLKNDNFMDQQNEAFEKEFIFFVGSMLYPKHLENITSKENERLKIFEIHSAFKSFSHQRLEILSNYNVFGILMLNYLDSQKLRSTKTDANDKQKNDDIKLIIDRLKQIYSHL